MCGHSARNCSPAQRAIVRDDGAQLSRLPNDNATQLREKIPQFAGRERLRALHSCFLIHAEEKARVSGALRLPDVRFQRPQHGCARTFRIACATTVKSFARMCELKGWHGHALHGDSIEMTFEQQPLGCRRNLKGDEQIEILVADWTSP